MGFLNLKSCYRAGRILNSRWRSLKTLYLLFPRIAADNGDGMVNENCRLLYNMKETYLEYYYLQTENTKNMEMLIHDSRTDATND